ncbi:sperm-associated antigen 16 protein-like [Solea solea]|uniref:sperm-associated antigen 16 protein-like n=1 Tax=Solea solea TaxID=90069 RepID=UPI00272A2073|nr:sperm-associated antigen 16 protein-like [Solea solea]
MSTNNRHEASSDPPCISLQPEAVDVFLRNFLFQTGMTETLDCFQTEWNELQQKGLLDAEQVTVIPDMYTDIQRLEMKVKNAQRERDEYRRDASVASDTLAKAEKARDFHRMHHQRVVQEREKLLVERRRIKAQCDNVKPALRRMKEKWNTLVKQTALLNSKRDKALGQSSRATSDPARTRQNQTVKRQHKQ